MYELSIKSDVVTFGFLLLVLNEGRGLALKILKRRPRHFRLGHLGSELFWRVY